MNFFEKQMISVVIPVFETPVDLLSQAVRSVFQQTYKNVEVIVCSDGAPIRTFNALSDEFPLEIRTERLRITRHRENRGIAAARNTASRLARGKWLVWLDADDTLEFDAIEALVTKSRGKIMVIGDCLLETDGVLIGRRPLCEIEAKARLLAKTQQDPFLTNVTSLQPQMIDIGAFRRLGGFDEKFRYAEITDLFLRFLAQFSIRELHFASDALYRYKYGRPTGWSRARKKLFDHRKQALLRYMRSCGLEGDVRYLRRDPATGFQMYQLI